MSNEARIDINGTRLTNNEAMVVRVALAAFADILATQLGFKDDGIAVSDRYQTDVARVVALLDSPETRQN